MTSKPTRNRAATTSRRAPATRIDEILPPLHGSAQLPVVRRISDPLLEPLEDDPDPEPFDHNGFDPAEFEWRPVARRARTDGWTPEVQVRFIETLAETGLVHAAAEAVDMSLTSCYRLRRAAGAESFARAWRVAMTSAAERLVDLAFERAIEGVEVPVFHDGRRIGARRQYNERMATFIMRAYLPEQFRHAHQTAFAAGEPPRAAAMPIAQALAALVPVTPADPHLLLSPDQLADLVGNERVMADVDARYPRDDRQHYVRPHVGDREESLPDPNVPEPYDPAGHRDGAGDGEDD